MDPMDRFAPDPILPTADSCNPCDPAAFCGMPAGSLHASAPRAVPLPRPLPLADQCWQRFCQGQSYAAIGRALALDRETVARYVKTLHHEVQADRRADRALALSRALAVQHQLHATAWDLLTHAHDQLLGAPTASPSASSPSSPSPTLAACARLLALILASAREGARLERLYDRDAPARAGDAAPQDTTVRLIIERLDPREAAAPPPPPGPEVEGPPPVAPDPDPEAAPEECSPIGITRGMPSRDLPPPPLPPVPTEAPAGQSGQSAAPVPAADPPPPPEPQPGWVSLGDGSSVWGYASPPAPGSAGSERAGERPRPRRVRFGLPVANGYSLG